MDDAKIIAALTKTQKEMAGKKGRTGTHKNRSNQYIAGTAQKERTDKAIGFKPKLEIYEAMVTDMERRGMTPTQWLDLASETLLGISNPKPVQVKLMKLHCTYAGFIRAGALYGQKIKEYETRARSSAIGKDYRGWVAIASSHAPEKPDWQLIERVANQAAATYRDRRWFERLREPGLYKPGCILAIARVSDVLQMGEDVYPDTELEEMTGDWEAGRWAIKLEDAIAPIEPIPYNIPAQGAVFLSPEKHGLIWEQVVELIKEYG